MRDTWPPPFYTVIKGTSWDIPHKDLPQVAQAQDPAADFNLQQKYQEYKALKTDLEKSKFTDGWTNEQKQAFYKYRTAEAQKEGQKNPQPVRPQPGQRYTPGGSRGGPPGGGGGRGAAGGQGDAIDPQLLREMYADGDVPQRRRTMPQNFDNPYTNRMRNIRRPYEGDLTEQQQQPQQQILANLNHDAAGNVDIWAHDESSPAGGQPAHTYHYRLPAIIQDPMFDTNVGD